MARNPLGKLASYDKKSKSIGIEELQVPKEIKRRKMIDII